MAVIPKIIKNDFENADNLVKIGGIIIIDDTDSEHISKRVDKYLSTGKWQNYR